jgi:hypothetical protein
MFEGPGEKLIFEINDDELALILIVILVSCHKYHCAINEYSCKLEMLRFPTVSTMRRHFAVLRTARAPLRSATFCFVTVFAYAKTRANLLRGSQNVAYAWSLCEMPGN